MIDYLASTDKVTQSGPRVAGEDLNIHIHSLEILEAEQLTTLYVSSCLKVAIRKIKQTTLTC